MREWLPRWLSGKEPTCSVQKTQVTQVQSLGQEDPLDEEMAPTPVFLPGKSRGQRSLAGFIVHGVARVGHDLVTKPPPPKLL